MSPSTQAAPPAFAADVTAFAAENGVADYLPAVLEMTRRVFPNCLVEPHLEDDPEIPDDRFILMDVDVTGLNEDQLYTARRQWTAAIFQNCPAPHVHFFQLGLWASA
jgi:hypothetical protein